MYVNQSHHCMLVVLSAIMLWSFPLLLLVCICTFVMHSTRNETVLAYSFTPLSAQVYQERKRGQAACVHACVFVSARVYLTDYVVPVCGETASAHTTGTSSITRTNYIAARFH